MPSVLCRREVAVVYEYFVNLPRVLLLPETPSPPITSLAQMHHTPLGTGIAGVALSAQLPSYACDVCSKFSTAVHEVTNSPACDEAWIRLSTTSAIRQ